MNGNCILNIFLEKKCEIINKWLFKKVFNKNWSILFRKVQQFKVYSLYTLHIEEKSQL